MFICFLDCVQVLDSKFGPPALLIGILLIITFLIVLSVLNPYLYSFLICMSSEEAFKELWVPSDPTDKRYLVYNIINLIFKSNYNWKFSRFQDFGHHIPKNSILSLLYCMTSRKSEWPDRMIILFYISKRDLQCILNNLNRLHSMWE